MIKMKNANINKRLYAFLLTAVLLTILSASSFALADSVGELKVTEEHPFYVNGSWIPASGLKVGDILRTIDGKEAEIIEIEDVQTEEPFLVYNFEDTFGLNNYVVGFERIIVHNSLTSKPTAPLKTNILSNGAIRSNLENEIIRYVTSNPAQFEITSNLNRWASQLDNLRNFPAKHPIFENSLLDDVKRLEDFYFRTYEYPNLFKITLLDEIGTKAIIDAKKRIIVVDSEDTILFIMMHFVHESDHLATAEKTIAIWGGKLTPESYQTSISIYNLLSTRTTQMYYDPIKCKFVLPSEAPPGSLWAEYNIPLQVADEFNAKQKQLIFAQIVAEKPIDPMSPEEGLSLINSLYADTLPALKKNPSLTSIATIAQKSCPNCDWPQDIDARFCSHCDKEF